MEGDKSERCTEITIHRGNSNTEAAVRGGLVEQSAAAVRNVLVSSYFGSEKLDSSRSDRSRGFVWVALFAGVPHVILSRSGV